MGCILPTLPCNLPSGRRKQPTTEPHSQEEDYSRSTLPSTILATPPSPGCATHHALHTDTPCPFTFVPFHIAPHALILHIPHIAMGHLQEAVATPWLPTPPLPLCDPACSSVWFGYSLDTLPAPSFPSALLHACTSVHIWGTLSDLHHTHTHDPCAHKPHTPSLPLPQ